MVDAPFDTLSYGTPARPAAARPRRWANPAHYATPMWKLCLFGFALGVGTMGFCELLLRAAA